MTNDYCFQFRILVFHETYIFILVQMNKSVLFSSTFRDVLRTQIAFVSLVDPPKHFQFLLLKENNGIYLEFLLCPSRFKDLESDLTFLWVQFVLLRFDFFFLNEKFFGVSSGLESLERGILKVSMRYWKAVNLRYQKW